MHINILLIEIRGTPKGEVKVKYVSLCLLPVVSYLLRYNANWAKFVNIFLGVWLRRFSLRNCSYCQWKNTEYSLDQKIWRFFTWRPDSSLYISNGGLHEMKGQVLWQSITTGNRNSFKLKEDKFSLDIRKSS